MDLTFGEQVKIILRRKGMTIKELAEKIEEQTGKNMSRQNLTQRLRRDNFQEQDMRSIAAILDCPFQLTILGDEVEEEMEQLSLDFEGITEEKQEDPAKETEAVPEPVASAAGSEEAAVQERVLEVVTEAEEEETPVYDFSAIAQEEESLERDVMIGELLDIPEEPVEETEEEKQEKFIRELLEEVDAIESEGEQREKEREEHVEQYEKEKVEKKTSWVSRLFGRKKKAEKEQEAEEKVAEKLQREEGETDGQTDTSAIFQTDVLADDQPISEQEAVERTEQQDAMTEEAIAEEIKEFTEAQDTVTEEAVLEYTQEYKQEYAQDEPLISDEQEEDLEHGDINPYTGREYATNSVRMHPKRIGYVQVYDRKDHKWTDMTEWAFLGYQERKKVLLGKDYEPPIYLD